MKKMSIALIATFVFACAYVCVAAERVVDAGNKICPVSGEKIAPEGDVTYEYRGKMYHFCCAACIPEFKRDPEKYIAVVNKEKAR